MSDREIVLMGTPFGPRLRLRRSGTEPYYDGMELVALDATLEVDDAVRAANSIQTLEGDGLDDWISGLADAFHGWKGERTWDSLEHDALMTATHDSVGHVALRVRLRGPRYGPDAWEALATLMFEAGEQMRRLAADVADFLATDAT